MHVLERLTNTTNLHLDWNKQILEKREEGRGSNGEGTPKEAFANAI